MFRFFVLILASIDLASSAMARDPAPIANSIDREIDKRLANAKLPASPVADDSEFLRRVTLDVNGRIPTLEKTIAFLDSKDPDKRRKLIDELLAGNEFGQHYATVWRNLLAPPGNPVKGKTPPDRFSPWLAEQFNRGRTWDQIVTDLLTVEGDIQKVPQSGFVMANTENFHPQANRLAASTARMFLGLRLGCTECHDHPFATWKQTDFWNMAAFFGRLRNTGKKGPPFILTEDPDPQPPHKDDPETIKPAPGGGIVLPLSTGKSSGKIVQARLLGGAEMKLDDNKPFRPIFTAWLTARENPYFAPTYVNRVWSQFFGRGFVNPVDDFRDGNAASHPELLKLLADEFRASGHDCKHLIRCICNSQAYQRASQALPENERDRELFSHMAVKVLSAEAFYDSLATLNAVYKNGTAQPNADKLELRNDFTQFFRPQGESDDENQFRQGIPQFLKRLNGATFNQTSPLIERLVRSGADRAKMIDGLYLATLSRKPRSDEIELMSKYLDRRPSAEKGYTGILWILLSSGEFALNH